MNTRKDKEDRESLKEEREAEKEERRAEKEEQKAEREERRAEAREAPAEGHEAVLKSRPTPTQEEQDAFVRGERPGEHEPDGSPESHGSSSVDNTNRPHIRREDEEEEMKRAGWKKATKDAEPESGASYKTRQANPDRKKED